MAEYIEREDLIRRLELSIKSWGRDCNSNAPVMARAYEDVLHKVKKLPAADVVKVVRCKDCKWCKLCYPAKAIGEEAIEGYYCNMFKQYREPNDYCGYGELKEREGK